MMKLTDVVNRINGNVDRFTTDLEYYIGGEHFESCELEISNKGLIKPNLNILGFKFHFAFQERDVIFMARNPHLRKAGMVFFSGLCSDASYILRSKDEKILTQEYLAVMLQSDHFWDYCEAHKVGSVNFAINWKTMANYEFDLPSLEKQNEISKKVWSAYRLKQSYKKLIEATDEMVKSQFIEMQIKSGQTNSLGDFIERCTPNRCGERTDLPILSVTKDKAIVFQDERFGAVVASNDKSNYIIAPRGYLVQGIHIDESNFGIQNLVDEGIVSPAYKLWRFKNSNAIPELIEYYLRSEMAIKYFRSKFLGATVPRRQVIRKEDFLDLPLNLPNMEEQKKYFRIYQQADKSKFELRKSIEAIDAVIKSLING